MKIVISGTTGVGKSTAVNNLKNYYQKKGKKVIIMGEILVYSPYFDLYFNNFSTWNFLAQLDFLFERFHQFIEIEQKYKDHKDIIIIYDRHFIEDKIFSELKLIKKGRTKLLDEAYKNVYNSMLDKINLFEKPDFFIVLRASFDVIMERMQKRNRSEEKKFDREYWQDLYYRYYSKKANKDIFRKYSKKYVELDTDYLTIDEVTENIIKYISKRI
ncbi:/ dck_1 / Deoxyadenosine/deoxycytidine kinase /:492374 Reverse [Candidatus Hepatoplasma crinochetorum]|uniref:/ dck_1 / Deoxyadenosine/deoxycytidine kinase /:492374 Reverse n=1 Tax=Candidatus Hepatoplasma crinochetorum TaxID=295596 RepID=A0A0G7ZN31_9MOLU|nr:/ dck_1 / Deoxyadenosine/deoxycytidine kinase /:492374 Reverse [Candidatus Hepatoplasma crinochetorum]